MWRRQFVGFQHRRQILESLCIFESNGELVDTLSLPHNRNIFRVFYKLNQRQIVGGM